MLAFDEIVDHPTPDRPWTIEGIKGGKIFQLVWLKTSQNIFHAAAFKLEDSIRQAFGENLIGLSIVHRELFQIHRFSGCFFD